MPSWKKGNQSFPASKILWEGVMTVAKIGIIGAGVMGHGIAQVAAQSGFIVVLVDIKMEFVENGIEKIKKFLEEGVKRGKISKEDVGLIMGRIKGTTDLTEISRVDLIIEAATEDLASKKEIFSKLSEMSDPNVVFATNTSYQSITELGRASKRPEKFVGMHWFNPPQLMRLVEVVKGRGTSDEAINLVVEVCKELGKVPIVCKDSPGFIVNRILQPWYNEAMNILDEGVASAEDIDRAIKLGGGFRMGPLELRDLVGLDTALKGTESIYQQLADEKFKPPQCLIKNVQAGYFGRKTGRGFYEYK
jgi:3-hydroxybutyryl-CoA dehydrogenase